MNSDDKNTPITKFVSKNGERMISRRDVLKASWTVPVILAVTPPSEVLAGSDTNFDPGEGYTPGYWRNLKKHKDDWKYDPDDDYGNTFGVTTNLNLSLHQAVDLKGKRTQEANLARAASAALLNAANPDINYPYAEDEVIALVQQAYRDVAKANNDKERDKIFEVLKDDFDAKNNL
jgi:hypothetical protein